MAVEATSQIDENQNDRMIIEESKRKELETEIGKQDE